MVFELSSNRSLDEIGRKLEESAARHQFGVLAVHDLKAAMQKKGVEYDGECRVYEVCNPRQAKQVLEVNAAISTALPCRISVYRAGDGYRLATLRPTALLGIFDAPGARATAEEVEREIIAMMEESA
jgi:uncharacterized protein (DUF302 family)